MTFWKLITKWDWKLNLLCLSKAFFNPTKYKHSRLDMIWVVIPIYWTSREKSEYHILLLSIYIYRSSCTDICIKISYNFFFLNSPSFHTPQYGMHLIFAELTETWNIDHMWKKLSATLHTAAAVCSTWFMEFFIKIISYVIIALSL